MHGGLKTFLLLILPFGLFAQLPLFELKNPITVTAAKTSLPVWISGRTVTIIDSAALANLPVASVQEALSYVAGVDVQQRGAMDVQADLSLRGSTFEQVLILVNGVRLNDPQTGHHNMNLPFSLENIERIEVLKGAGSRMFGPGAFGGVVNIITKSEEKSKMNVGVSGGDFGYYQGRVAWSVNTQKASHFLTFTHNASNGYRPNTDFKTYTVYYDQKRLFHWWNLRFSTGAKFKDFGASRFYHPDYPNQREKINTVFATISAQKKMDNREFNPQLYWRFNSDDFVLDFQHPEWYRNKHYTNVFGLDSRYHFSGENSTTVLGFQWYVETIRSTNLGNHFRQQGGLSFEHQKHFGKSLFVIGSNFFYYPSHGLEVSPGLDWSYQISPQLVGYASFGSGFRLPSYTELYYDSPANRGNSQLRAEKNYDYEIGMRFRNNGIYANLAFFRRFGSQLIDWVRKKDQSFWQAINIASLVTDGIEVEVEKNLFTKSGPLLSFNYSYLSANKALPELESRYVLNYLKHQLLLRLQVPFAQKRTVISGAYRYQNRVNGKAYQIVDLKIKWKFKSLTIWSTVNNLLNESYYDINSVIQPGRWFKMGLEYRVF